jgi:NAD(P)-dependent dehydrogenase (short-subunit alcohol dehydrogenase family)
MSDKVVAITGANAGIGYAAAHTFAKLNAEVHLVCRNAGDKIKSSLYFFFVLGSH